MFVGNPKMGEDIFLAVKIRISIFLTIKIFYLKNKFLTVFKKFKKTFLGRTQARLHPTPNV